MRKAEERSTQKHTGRRPWVAPVFERVSLSEAQNLPGNGGDGGALRNDRS